MTSRSVPPSVPAKSLFLPGFSFCSIDLGELVSTDAIRLRAEFSADSTGVIGCFDCTELTLAVRSGSGSGTTFGGSVTGGSVSTSGVAERSFS